MAREKGADQKITRECKSDALGIKDKVVRSGQRVHSDRSQTAKIIWYTLAKKSQKLVGRTGKKSTEEMEIETEKRQNKTGKDRN